MSDWIRWMQKLQAIAQTGLHYSNSPFDAERYEKLLAIAVEIGANHSTHSVEEITTTFRLEDGYATPRVDVRAACFRDNKILLVQEKADGCWALPGGWADVGDRPSSAAEREVLEESGFHCSATRVIGVYDANRVIGELSLFHAYKLVFLCELEAEIEGTESPEILAKGFFALDEIPPLSTNRTSPELIRECFLHAADPIRPTYFE